MVLNEEEKKSIEKEAKDLMLDFSDELEGIGDFSSESEGVEPREEGEPWRADKDFRDLMFLNAPFVEGDFLVAERAKWKRS